MRRAQIVIGENPQGVLAQAAEYLQMAGYNCVYTQDAAELAQLFASRDVDILVVSHAIAVEALCSLPSAEVDAADPTLGYIIDLPGKSEPNDPPHLRRSVVQRISTADSGKAIAEYVNLAIPRVLVLREARAASRYIQSIDQALNASSNASGDGPKLDRGAVSHLANSGDGFESISLFMHGAPKTADECRYQRCDHYVTMARAIKNAIEVLRATKNHFKSKELAELRKNLEATLNLCIFHDTHAEPGARAQQ